MKKHKRILVTAALPYANGPLHIGHLSGAYLPADIYVKYQRLRKREVVFVCGSDEHGVAITIKAHKENTTPEKLIEKYHHLMKETFGVFKIDFDIYHRTHDALHFQVAQSFFLNFYEKGLLEEKNIQQYYDEKMGMFLADRYILGTCPRCGFTDAYGDQCERCGSSLSPQELIEPRSALSDAKPILKETKHWYLPLDRFQKQIEAYLEQHTDWKSNVYGQCKSWLQEGLKARAITRDLAWGVPVPLPDAHGKVLYVWFDAPIGYISATQALLPDTWQNYWQSTDTKLVHFIGKDNIVFHCIIFPMMLMAHGNYVLPDNVPANEFLNLEGQKISTSRDWAVWLHEFAQEFPDLIDVLRYTLTATLPETKDNDFTWKEFQQRNNNELADIYGNFVNRVVTLLHKYYNGKVPFVSGLASTDEQALAECVNALHALCESIEAYRFREALASMMKIARIGNKYLMDKEPWKTVNSDPETTAQTLYTSAQITALLAYTSKPFLPYTYDKLQKLLNLPIVDFNQLLEPNASVCLLNPGHWVEKPFVLFPKLTDEWAEQQTEKLHNKNKPQINILPFKEPIPYSDFEKLDIRVGTIISAQKVPKTDKLLELHISDGIQTRTIVSGIAEHFTPEELHQKQIVFIANLEPRKIKGIVSHGMLLTAQDPDGKLHLVSPQNCIPDGSIVK